MPIAPSNTFDEGEQVDIVVKRNETFRRGFLVEEKDPDTDEWEPVPLTGATIEGGLKKAYDDPTLLKAFTIVDRDDAGGYFGVELDLGLAGGKLTEAPWDCVVTLSGGRKIRVGAGVAKISQGVAGVT